jgi:eukaryotic-like serine/threonine-protein kinase
VGSNSQDSCVIQFGAFQVDLHSGELRKAGIKLKLHAQPFQILAMLLEQPGKLISREEIRQRLWPEDTFVDFDHGLNNAVNRLREALGDSAATPRFIETVPRRGYRFIAGINGTDSPKSYTSLQPSSAENKHGESVSNENSSKATGSYSRVLLRWPIWVGVLVLAVVPLIAFQLRKATSLPSRRLFLLPPEGATYNLIGDEGGSIAVSPDSTRIAFIAMNSGGIAQVWIRQLGKLAAEPIDGTEGATFPFWSPDGRWIGFFSGGKLKKVRSDGRTPPLTLCDAPFGRGGSWNSRGVIIFAPTSHSSICQVADTGGVPIPITKIDSSIHTTHRWPKFLRDNKHFVYLAANHFNPATSNGIYFGSLDGKVNSLVVASDADATEASGYLFFLHKGSLMAQPFNSESGQLEGEPQPTTERVLYDPTIWKVVFDASNRGVMAYQLGNRVSGNQFRWYDRTGKEQGLLGEPNFEFEPSISPNGRKLAVCMADGGYSRLWIYDLTLGVRKQITFSKYDYSSPIWSPDGVHVYFDSKREHYSIYQVDSRGTELEKPILDTGSDTWPLDVSSDGRFLLYAEGMRIGGSHSQIWVYPLDAKSHPFRLLKGEAIEGDAKFSPDGRWVAYTSNESGRNEVYVVRFWSQKTHQPENSISSEKWQVSNSGGHTPRWSRNNRELFYLAQDNTLTAVSVTTRRGSGFAFEAGHPLFRANPGFYGISYDVSPEGSRFIINTAPQEKTAPITVVENWLSDFKR